jgi:putative iron-regulated protein
MNLSRYAVTVPLFNLFLGLIFTATSLSATAQDNSQILNDLGHKVILQSYLDLAKNAVALRDSVNDLSSEPTPEKLKLAQDQWKKLRSYWESSEAFLFGPVTALNIDPTLDTWPITIPDVEAVLVSQNELSVEFVSSLGVNLQGFHVIEYLLFGNGKLGPNKPINLFTPREFDYLKATTQIMVNQTTMLTDAWTKNADPDQPEMPGFIEFITKPSADNPYYQSEKAVLNELVLGMAGILDEVANAKLTDPLGDSPETADDSLLESPFSWNSLEDLKNNVESTIKSYTGYYNTPGAGIRDFVMPRDPDLAAKIDAQLVMAQSAIAAIPGRNKMDLRDAIKDPAGRKRILKAIQELNTARDLLSDKVIPMIEALP